MKKFSKKFFLTNLLRATLKRSLRTCFSAKKHFFVFYRNFGFNLEILSNHYSQLKKHLKLDPETRSYDFLTKTREKDPMFLNVQDLVVTLENAMLSRFMPNNCGFWCFKALISSFFDHYDLFQNNST